MVKFSIIAPAIRQDCYERFYKAIDENNHTPFEVVFVGYAPPLEKMPPNFRYIYTKVNAAQCLEIAAREAVGEYLVIGADDAIYSPCFFDRLDYYLSKAYTENSLVGGRYQTNGVFWDNILVYHKRVKNSPVISTAPAFKKEVWHKLGGVDRRFAGIMVDLDMMLRFYKHGYSPFIAPDIWVNEIRDNKIVSTLHNRVGRYSRKVCDRLWIKDGVFSKSRLEPVMSFDDKDILIRDQFVRYIRK